MTTIQSVFENEHFIVVDKDAMVLTTPSRDGAKDPRLCLGLALQEQLRQQIYPVHRLDFEVSGIVMFAKTPKAHSQANAWFEKKDVFKIYQSFSEQKDRDVVIPEVGQEFFWKCKLLRGKRRAYEHEIGKNAETVAVYRGASASEQRLHQWELHPLTGRPHQLRYELFRHGFPIAGDALYGSSVSYSHPGIALRAIKVDFNKAPGADKFGLPAQISVRPLF